MTHYERYCELQDQLWDIQYENNDEESPEEDAILDQMDDIWWKLSVEEQAHFDVPRSKRR
jgi:hypothetical protein